MKRSSDSPIETTKAARLSTAAQRIADLLYSDQPHHSHNINTANLAQKLLARKPLFELLKTVYPESNLSKAESRAAEILIPHHLTIDASGNLVGDLAENKLSHRLWDFVSNDEYRFIKMLTLASKSADQQTTSQQNNHPEREYLTEFGCRNFSQYLDFVTPLLEQNDLNQRFLSDLRKIHTKHLENDEFFENFVLALHKTKVEFSLAFEEYDITPFSKIRNHKLLRTKQPDSNITAELYKSRKSTVEIDQQRFAQDESQIINISNISTFCHSTIGVSRPYNEDSHIIGKSVCNDSRLIPSFLKKTCQELGLKIRNDAESKQINQGSTAILATYSPDGVLNVANIGDSRATIFMLNYQDSKAEVSYKRLSCDHQPNDFFERTLIAKNGGMVIGNRVSGDLGVARGFGDIFFKDDAEINYLTNYESEIVTEDVSKLKQKYEEIFFLLSCDGPYEQNLNEACYAKALEDWFNNAEIQRQWQGNIAHYLSDYAMIDGSCDNNTILFSNISELPLTTILLGLFDGHGYGYGTKGAIEISHSAAVEIATACLIDDHEKFIYPAEAKSILAINRTRSDSSEIATVIDEDSPKRNNTPSPNPTQTHTSQVSQTSNAQTFLQN